MRQSLESLDDIGKLKYAIECVEHNTTFPTVISDFLIHHGLYELITKPKVRNANKKSNPKRK